MAATDCRIAELTDCHSEHPSIRQPDNPPTRQSMKCQTSHTVYEIEIADSQNVETVDVTFLRDVVAETLAIERLTAASVSVALVNDKTIHELNRQYLGHDYPTDVLSFLLECETDPDAHAAESAAAGPAQRLRGRGKRLEGEVIVSVETAARSAREFDWSTRDEVVLYLVHGLLHLCGYDDLSSEERQIMRARERAILGLWGLKPPFETSTRPQPASRKSGEDS